MIVLLFSFFCAKNVFLTRHLGDLLLLFVFVGLWVLFLITNTLEYFVMCFFVGVHRCVVATTFFSNLYV